MASGRNIKGITVEIDGNVTGLEKALKSVNATIRETQTQLKDVERLLKLDPTNTELLSQKQTLLKEKITATKEKLDALKTASEQAAKTAGNYDAWKTKHDAIQKEIDETKKHLEELKKKGEEADKQLAEGKISKEKYDSIQNEIKETEDKLKTLQKQSKDCDEEFGHPLSPEKFNALQREIIETEEELKKMAREAAEANTALTKIGETGKKLESVGNKMSSVGSSLTRNVTAPILAIGTAAVKTTADFDASMSKVAAVSGATGKEFDDLRAKAREMGAKTKFSASEAADAMNYMAMAGWKTGDMLEGIEGIMNLAAASGEDLATTSDIVTDALTAFGLKAKDSGHFADVLAAASSNANTNVSMLGESFKYAAPVAGALGISAEDTSIALGLMANAGIKASQSGTALRTGLTNLAKPTKQMQTYMDQYGISLVENADGSINLRDTMISLREKMGSLSETEQAAAASAIFGKNSMAGWLAIINASDEDFEKLTSAIDNCDGAAEDMAATMQDNLAGQITILKSALQELMIQIGDALMPTIRNIVSKIQDFVVKLQQMDEGTRNTIIKIAAFAAALGPVLLVVGKLTTGVGKGLQAISSLGKGILTFVNQAKLGVGAGGKIATAIAGIGPVGWAVIAVVAALTAAFVHLWKNNEEFREKVTAIWESVKAKFAEAARKITDAINSLGGNFKDLGEVISAAWDWLCNALEPIVTGVLKNIGQVIMSIVDVVTGVIEIIAGLIKGFKEGDWSTFLDGLKSLWDGIWGLLSAPVKAVIDVIGGYLEKFGTSWREIWNGIRDFFVNLWEGIKNTVTNVLGWIKTAVTNGWNAVKSTTETIWNGTKNFVSTTWENIKTSVSGFVDGIKEKVSTVWGNIKTTVGDLMGGIKDKISEKWEAAKTAVTTTVENIKSGVSDKWTNIKTTVATTVDNIKTAVSDKWTSIKEKVGSVVETLKGSVSSKWEAIKSDLGSKLSAISSDMSSKWETIKSNIGSKVDSIKSGIESKWNSIKSSISSTVSSITSGLSSGFQSAYNTVSSKFESIKSKISGVMDTARNTVQNAINRIKGFFNFSWSLPKLKLPHLSISGSFSINPPSVPHFSISWYKKAMEDGMILNSPTIFGMKGNSLLAGGEAGSETVVGTKSLMTMIRDAVSSMSSVPGINYGGVYITVNAAEGQDEMAIARNVADIIQNQVGREAAVWA